MKKFQSFLWKIYFLIWILLSADVFHKYFYNFYHLTIRDLFELVLLVPISIIAVFSFIFKRFRKYQNFWRFFFWFSIIDEILNAIYISDKNNAFFSLFYKSNVFPPDDSISPAIVLVIFLIIELPFFYILYRLSYPRKVKPGIDWVTITTERYEESVRFYRDILGFSVKEEIAKDEFCRFSLPNCTFAIFGRKQMEKLVGKRYLSKPGATLLTYPESENIEKDYEDLKAKGVKFIKDLETQPWGQRTAYFTDPDGHIWEIQQWIKH